MEMYLADGTVITETEAEEIQKRNNEIFNRCFELGEITEEMLDIEFIFKF